MVSLALQPPGNMELIPTMLLRTPQRQPFSFSFATTKPPTTDPLTTVQRADEVNTLQRMLNEPQTSVLTLTGYPGVGKSTLAALLFQRLQLAAQAAVSAPKHFVWLRIGAYSTLSDVIAAILSRINTVHDPALFLQTAEQQITLLIRTLSRPKEPALIVLDAFDHFLHPETNQGITERGAIPLFLEQLQTDLGASRIVLICHRSPYNLQETQEKRVRSYLVSRISIPEGIAFLQQRGVQGSYEELSLIWQRCAGRAYSLVLFSTLYKLSRFPLGYFLHSPECHYLWNGEVILQFVEATYRSLNPIQRTLLRILSVFDEPVPVQGISAILTAEHPGIDTTAYEQELHILLQHSLVLQTENRHKVPCYWLHPLLQQYVLEHYLSGVEQRQPGRFSTSLGVSGPITPIVLDEETREVALAAVHMHVADYYRKQTEDAYIPGEKRTSVQDIEPILSTIRHLCQGWHWQQACDILFREGLYESMVQWGAWDTLIGLYAGILPPSGVLTRRDEGLAYNHLGLIYGRLGDYKRSYAYYEEALALQRKVGDTHGEATSLTNEGELFRTMGEIALARANFEQVLRLNNTLQDSLVAIVIQHNLALLYHAEKNYAQAIRCYQDALLLAEYAHEDHKKGTIFTNIGCLLFEQGYQAESLAIMLYVLKSRARLQFYTIDFIQSFLETLEHNLGLKAFTQLRQTALGKQAQVIAQLLSP